MDLQVFSTDPGSVAGFNLVAVFGCPETASRQSRAASHGSKRADRESRAE